MDNQNSNSKTMDCHGPSLHLQVPKFENHFILPNFSRTNFFIKDVTSITKLQLSELLWTYLSFYQLFLYLFILVNLYAIDYNIWLHSSSEE